MSNKYRCHLNNWWDRFIDWFIDLLIDWLINWLVNSLTWKGLVYVIVHSWISLRQTFCSQESFIYYFSLNIWGYIYIKLSYTYTCIYIYSQNTDLSDHLHWWVVWVFCFCFFFIIRLKEDTEEYHKLIVKFQIGEIDIILFCLRFFSMNSM